ncbi:hypothetical protein JTB14_037383 [Gonioctena quinquepunctata]|nr:hypothetical protein JTB14_037383 [Gonioctena quinquepunctata]
MLADGSTYTLQIHTQMKRIRRNAAIHGHESPPGESLIAFTKVGVLQIKDIQHRVQYQSSFGIPQHILINNLHPKIGQIFAEVGQKRFRSGSRPSAEGQLKELANE